MKRWGWWMAWVRLKLASYIHLLRRESIDLNLGSDPHRIFYLRGLADSLSRQLGESKIVFSAREIIEACKVTGAKVRDFPYAFVMFGVEGNSFGEVPAGSMKELRQNLARALAPTHDRQVVTGFDFHAPGIFLIEPKGDGGGRFRGGVGDIGNGGYGAGE